MNRLRPRLPAVLVLAEVDLDPRRVGPLRDERIASSRFKRPLAVIPVHQLEFAGPSAPPFGEASPEFLGPLGCPKINQVESVCGESGREAILHLSEDGISVR